ncbi:MAG: hypothetical protein MUC56_00770 [Thermoanaerobaculales bacterium]|jgi:hypothetical protein|nr:hypothetical protein [Thermoanaerobaculales bacterium]
MTGELRGFRLSSARRRPPPGSGALPLAVTLVVLAMVLVVVLAVRDEAPVPIAEPTPSPTAAAAISSSPTPSPTPGPAREQSSWVNAAVVLPPAPSPTFPVVAPAPTRAPRPTPSVAECAAISWSALQVFTPSAQVKVDIRVANRCPFDLDAGNLLVEITGWRDGGRVQSVRGAPFETIRRGRGGELSIGLPGSIDWYDRIDVVVMD